MRLSTKGIYGMQLLFELAKEYGNLPMSIRIIAQERGLSELYLEQLVIPLKKAEIVVSRRGAMGGYSLARSPDKITVGECLRALEGSLLPTDCVSEDHSCDKDIFCAMRVLSSKLNDAISSVVDFTTLHDILLHEENITRKTLI